MGSEMGRERRQHERIATGLAVRLSFTDGVVVHGRMENLSRGGCYIRSSELAGCSRWESCVIAVLLDDVQTPQNLDLPARLLWSDQRGAGFCFESLAEALADQLAGLLRDSAAG